MEWEWRRCELLDLIKACGCCDMGMGLELELEGTTSGGDTLEMGEIPEVLKRVHDTVPEQTMDQDTVPQLTRDQREVPELTMGAARLPAETTVMESDLSGQLNERQISTTLSLLYCITKGLESLFNRI